MQQKQIVIGALIKAGWTKDRKIEKDKIVSKILSEGYPIFNNVISFLENFGNLIFHFENKRNGITDDFNFCFERAMELEVPERILGDYQNRVKKGLCSIGTAYREHFVLLMSDDNHIYGGYSDSLYFIADSPENAIEAIILDYDFIEIPG